MVGQVENPEKNWPKLGMVDLVGKPDGDFPLLGMVGQVEKPEGGLLKLGMVGQFEGMLDLKKAQRLQGKEAFARCTWDVLGQYFARN